MKRIVVGVLLGLAILSRPINSSAYQAQEPIELTYEDAQELMKIAWCEAGNQGIDGQRFVMSVVLNRVESEAFPDTIHEVITQESQFCAANKMKSATITAETHLALCEIEKGNVTPKIIAFGTPKADSELQKYFTPAFTYKDHIFYTEKH